ncbi:hypothetical protein DACRYDRAFT_87837 [Dacryopinax primogenitus]|uniref:Glycosyltransferase family 32 protein n=1 Tax=Dacryopinax primogenitus (strain DJM 731) TaxID=1858805 RepID=M5G4L2_DACPD|nr:uncharacterized protein DACRYDRAFT_87837 [Dacryopinax primogenitus]EJU03629.1 hypothetical protein DACRYDRAFT_87837 [Dacryopinax primogenitus]
MRRPPKARALPPGWNGDPKAVLSQRRTPHRTLRDVDGGRADRAPPVLPIPRDQLLLVHHRPGCPPHGPWWNLIEPYVTLSPVEPPGEIFGNPLTHYAHKADVLRMQIMLQFGGVYLDQDTFVLRSFDRAGLFTQSTVLAMEADPYEEWEEWEPGGLCNAIMVSRPEAPFLQRWFSTYRTFNESGHEWAEHSVAMPWVRPD